MRAAPYRRLTSVLSQQRQASAPNWVANPLVVVFRPRTLHHQQLRLGYMLVLPSLAVLCFTVFWPIVQTLVYSLHTNKLNQPFLGTPFVWFANYSGLLSQAPFWKAISHTQLARLRSVL